MAQMRQITCCLINLAIALMAVLRRLARQQSRKSPGLLVFGDWFKNTYASAEQSGSLWHQARCHVDADEVSHKKRSRTAYQPREQLAFGDHFRHRSSQHDAQNQKADSNGRKVHHERMRKHVATKWSPLAEEAEAQTACHD